MNKRKQISICIDKKDDGEESLKNIKKIQFSNMYGIFNK